MTLRHLLFSFKGRVGRMKWWLVVAICFLAACLINALVPPGTPTIGNTVGLVVILAIMWILLAVTVKRWHDIGKSGWWILSYLVGGIGLIFNGFLPGHATSNQYDDEILSKERSKPESLSYGGDELPRGDK